jgi:hypothetical protein
MGEAEIELATIDVVNDYNNGTLGNPTLGHLTYGELNTGARGVTTFAKNLLDPGVTSLPIAI